MRNVTLLGCGMSHNLGAALVLEFAHVLDPMYIFPEPISITATLTVGPFGVGSEALHWFLTVKSLCATGAAALLLNGEFPDKPTSIRYVV